VKKFIIALLVSACGFSVADVTVDPEAKPKKKLSDYGFFKAGEASPIEPAEGVIPYDMNTPLFSDYASKHRHIWMPEGQTALYRENDVFEFPVGTVLIKSFGYYVDMRDPTAGETIMETRLLVNTSKGWKGYPYVWNEAQTDAVLKVAGTTMDMEWIHLDGKKRSTNYIIPNMNQCKSCHEQSGELQPLGPRARNMNKTYPYSSGEENQIGLLTRIGYLSGAPSPKNLPSIPKWDVPTDGTVEERARGWLDVNCMHCHNPNGAGSTSGLDLSYHQRNPRQWGVMKAPVAAGRGSGDFLFDIVPGKPEESILVYRIESIDPGVMMPELPRRLVDEEGVALIKEWIAQMEMPPDEVSQD
jgi:uncharacterized repeat protein (TIGR03806 family)